MQEPFFDPEDFREGGRPEGEVYPGFWWVQWSGLQNHSFLVKHLHFRRSTGSTLSADGGWLLDGLTEDPGGDFICGASPTQGASNPTLSFLPDHKGRAQTTHTDSHGEGAVTLTSLGENLIEGLTSYRLDIDGESELEAIGLLNNFLLHHARVRLDDVSFELSAQVGGVADQETVAWSN